MLYPSIKQSLGIVGIAILSMILFTPLNFLLSEIAGKELSFLIYYVFAMGVPLIIAHMLRKKYTGISSYDLNPGSIKTMVLVTIIMIAIQLGITQPIISALPIPEFMEKLFLELADMNGVASFLAIVILAPVIEEWIFRGIILDGLLKKYSPVKSILISSVLFGVVHLNPWQFISAVIIGVFSGWVYYHTRKLTLSILIHLVNNLFAFTSMLFIDVETMMNMSLSQMYGGTLNFILISLAAILIAILGIYMLKKRFEFIKN